MEAPCSRSKECTWNSCDVRRFQTRVSFGRPRRRIFATESVPKLFVVSPIIFALALEIDKKKRLVFFHSTPNLSTRRAEIINFNKTVQVYFKGIVSIIF